MVVHGALHVDQDRRAFRIPTMLVLAHPLHAHRQSGFLGDQGRVGGGILVPVSPVATGAFDMDQPEGRAVRIRVKPAPSSPPPKGRATRRPHSA